MLSYHFLKFKKVKIIILYKLNKKNYIVLKMYRLIIVLNILRKALKVLVTLRLIVIIEKYNFLLEKHISN